ncbi:MULTISPECIES: NAD(P)H-binding protein [unclassified Streptomyces]|uniref:NAD(P)H-binding protein n=1 Tax=unclassified Streptomyces TaxID=2593676 RepID=UPI002255C7C6|nr:MULTISPECIES: NAD(P)H-binding protein [unclassified Streptomyces]MCX5149913.1 NAD(P)H-binding protein [Streptomyces sp. NBC_00320]WSN52939.1 NAD(P)H-binding protein [Streptomyces sp. NBC_01296]WSW57552.1 NAD(P)H-binding protein [Streptomyces sp. NBC_00998]
MIVITAPTGNIGSHLLSLLLESAPAHGEELRVVVRDPARLPDAVRDRVEVVTGSHGDAEVVDRAFEGADAVFWLVPPDASLTPEDAYCGFTRPAAKALVAHGIGHVVGVSALGRGTPVAHRAGLVSASLAMDDLIAGTGVAYRALACPSFFENLLEDADTIRETGVFTDAIDAGLKAPRAAVADIAAVAADLLRNRSWSGNDSVPVLGPEDLSPDDLARVMTEQLGRPVRYARQPLDELHTDLLGYRLNEAFAQGVVDMKRAKNEGLDAGVTRTRATGSPTTFAQWCARTLKPAVLPEGTRHAR